MPWPQVPMAPSLYPGNEQEHTVASSLPMHLISQALKWSQGKVEQIPLISDYA